MRDASDPGRAGSSSGKWLGAIGIALGVYALFALGYVVAAITFFWLIARR